jgi:hypothetical protein
MFNKSFVLKLKIRSITEEALKFVAILQVRRTEVHVLRNEAPHQVRASVQDEVSIDRFGVEATDLGVQALPQEASVDACDDL